jgi:O-antigen/teichoic acid export membrane protein
MQKPVSNQEASKALFILTNAGYGLSGSLISILLKLAIGLIIARTIGPESFGIYVLAINILLFAEILSLLGLDRGLVKFVSQFKALGDVARLRGVIWIGSALVFVTSILVGAVLFSSAPFLNDRFFEKPAVIPILRIMIISLPFSTLLAILLASLQGAKRIKYKVFVNQLWVPFIRLAGITLALILGYRLRGITWAYVLSIACGVLFSGYFVGKSLPQILKKGALIFEKKKISLFSLPLLFSAIFNRIQGRVDILLIGHFLSANMIGIYGVTQRLLPLVVIPLAAFNNIFAPIISELFSSKRYAELEHQFKMVAKWILMTCLPIFTLLIFFAKEILSIVGPDFTKGYKAMIVLCIGQMIIAATGSTGFMLMMTGRSLVNLINAGVLCVACILLNLYLIPRYGITGAAVANTLAVTTVQLLRLTEVWYFLKMHPFQSDSIKPVISCIFSGFILVMITHLGINKSNVFMLPILSILFLVIYISTLWLLKLSPEDRMVYAMIKDKLLNRNTRHQEVASINGKYRKIKMDG